MREFATKKKGHSCTASYFKGIALLLMFEILSTPVGSPGLVVMRGDSHFEYQPRRRDGQFSHYIVVKS